MTITSLRVSMLPCLSTAASFALTLALTLLTSHVKSSTAVSTPLSDIAHYHPISNPYKHYEAPRRSDFAQQILFPSTHLTSFQKLNQTKNQQYHRHVEFKFNLPKAFLTDPLYNIKSSILNSTNNTTNFTEFADFHFMLNKNEDLFHPGYQEWIYHDGQLIQTNVPQDIIQQYDSHIQSLISNLTSVNHLDHCYYQGHLYNDTIHAIDTSVTMAVSTCDNKHFGVIMKQFDNSSSPIIKQYIIEYHDQLNQHIVYDLEHLDQPERRFHNDDGQHIHADFIEPSQLQLLTNTTSLAKQMRKLLQTNSALVNPSTSNSQQAATGKPSSSSSTNSLNTPLYENVLVINDNSRYKDKQSQTQSISANIMNLANTLYVQNLESPPLRLSLTAQITFTDKDPYTPVYNSDGEVTVQSLLTDFLAYSTNLGNVNPYNQRTLISGMKFESYIVGFAPLGAMCSSSQSGAIVQAVSFADVNVANTVAHENGHLIGMSHDGVSNNCATTGFIMAAISTLQPSQTFSDCSLSAYNLWYNNQASSSCLLTTPGAKYGTCGNGVLEGDEACDCPASNRTACQAADPCCNYATCQLNSGSTCSSAQVCCTSQCQFVTSSQAKVCRASVDSICDQAETCDGKQSICPMDVYSPAGTKCNDGNTNNTSSSTMDGLCFQATCHSNNKQCQAISSSFNTCSNGNSKFQQSTVSNDQTKQCSQTTCNDVSSSICTLMTAQQTKTPNGWSEDGIPCQLTSSSVGQCKNGQCQSSQQLDNIGIYSAVQPDTSILNDLLNNPTSKKNIIIICSVVGSVLLCCLLMSITRCCIQKRKYKKSQRRNKPWYLTDAQYNNQQQSTARTRTQSFAAASSTTASRRTSNPDHISNNNLVVANDITTRRTSPQPIMSRFVGTARPQQSAASVAAPPIVTARPLVRTSSAGRARSSMHPNALVNQQQNAQTQEQLAIEMAIQRSLQDQQLSQPPRRAAPLVPSFNPNSRQVNNRQFTTRQSDASNAPRRAPPTVPFRHNSLPTR